MNTVTKQAAVALVALLALTSFCSLEGKPVETSASEEEVVEVRGMVFDPTAETGELILCVYLNLIVITFTVSIV